jgi:diaminopimelate decarboxylase
MSVALPGSARRTEIAGLSVAELARQFGTPLYVYDASVIRQRLQQLARFDVVRYAQKALSNLAVLAYLRRLGAVVDAVSAGEIHRALRAGYAPQGEPYPIVYTADLFDHDSLRLVVEHGIHVNCGSPDMIEQLAEAAGGHPITLRINPGFGHGHSRKTNTGGEHSKHGIWHTQLAECLQRAAHAGHRVVGLHLHIGSGTDLEHLAQVCAAAEKLALAAGETLQYLSAGGGLPIPYRPGEQPLDLEAYFELWDATRQRLSQRLGRPLRLEIEPGRFLVAESGFLISEIRAIKQQGANTFYLVDAGFNNLARPILYGAYHPMSIAPAVPHDEAGAATMQPVVVGGPLCESGDIFTQEEGGFVATRQLPQARVGDYLVVECAGAYGFVMGSNYNSKPLAAEVLVVDGRPHLVRQRQTLDDLLQGERIPDWNAA